VAAPGHRRSSALLAAVLTDGADLALSQLTRPRSDDDEAGALVHACGRAGGRA
jgi:hypothetical protein